MQDQNEIHFTHFPVIAWFVGFFCLGAAMLIFTREGLSSGVFVMGGAGLLFIFLPGIVFITANRTERILFIERRSLSLIGSSKKIRFEEIAVLRLNKQRAKKVDRGRKKLFAYRMEVVLKNGDTLPFRAAFSSGNGEKQRDMTQQLSAFIGCAADIPSLSPYEE